MGKYFMLALIFVSTFGWWATRRKLTSLDAENTRRGAREIDEVLPEVAQSAWLAMHDTLFSISMYRPFLDDSDDDWGDRWSQLGIEYRASLTEAQVKWFEKYQNTNLSPLEFAKAALTSFDEVLEKYRNEIDQAHSLLMKRYEGKTMPRRNQDGFNWVKIW